MVPVLLVCLIINPWVGSDILIFLGFNLFLSGEYGLLLFYVGRFGIKDIENDGENMDG